jgi:hypothetical protein
VNEDSEGNKYISLVSYNGSSEKVVLPDEIDSVKVTSMMSNYKNPSVIKTIVLSKYVHVDSLNFHDLDSLEEIQVTDGNADYWAENGILFAKYGKRIELVFYPRNKKGSTYTIPSNVNSASDAFYKNNNLKKLIMNNKMTDAAGAEESNIETLVLSDSIKYIQEASFSNCKKLKKVVMGKNVTTICESAFKGCTSLSQITLPDKLKTIEYWAFKDCKALKSVKIPDSVQKISAHAFDGCNANIKKAAYLQKQKDGSYIAKADVTVNKTGKTKQYNIKKFNKISTADKNIVLKKGKTQQIKTKVYVSGKKIGILDSSILKYTVSDKKIVKVSGKGKITALKKGTATIKVELAVNHLSYKIKVRVK